MQPIHILNQLGILSSFSVAKKITEEDIKKCFNKEKKSGKTDAEINKILHQKILGEIQEAIINNQIPGLISSQDLAKEFGIDQKVVDKVPELNRLIMIIANK